MNITTLPPTDLPVDAALRERVVNGRLDRTVEFLAVQGGAEAGLLIFDPWPSGDIGIIYEIYVLRAFRGKGIGTKLLTFAENYAAHHGRSSLQLTARSLDQEFMSTSHLREWYSRHGFRGDDPNAAMMKYVPLADPLTE